MAILKADSPLSRRIVRSFLEFLDSVEPASIGDVESLEVAKDCLLEAFKIDPSSSCSDSLVQIFSSIKSDQIHEELRECTNNAVDTTTPGASQRLGDIERQDTRAIGVREDELFGQFFGALENAHYFGTTNNRDDEQELDRATHLFHNALMEMKNSGSEEIDLKNLADTFKLQGNKAMQSKLYSEAIELYSIAIALCDDNAVYYCNRAAAYTQTNQYTEAIHDCHQSIAIDPNYSKAYSRLGFTYYAQGNYRDAIHKGFNKALQLDPSNESVKGNIQAAEQKLKEEQRRAEHDQNSSSSSHSGEGSSSRASAPSFTSIPFNVNGHPFDMASMLRNMTQGRPEGGNGSTEEPGVNQMPEEFYGAIRSVVQMFSDGTSSHVGSQDNSNGS